MSLPQGGRRQAVALLVYVSSTIKKYSPYHQNKLFGLYTPCKNCGHFSRFLLVIQTDLWYIESVYV